MQRGGAQRIPRPPLARGGRPSPWARLSPEQRRFSVEDIRALCAGLPGPKRHLVHAPGIRAAAVLMPFFDRGGEAHVVLTKRPEHMPTHQGEISFPGGKHDERDRSLQETALREMEEEIGVPRAAAEIVGELRPHRTFSSRFGIVPFVGILTVPGGAGGAGGVAGSYRTDPGEVERVLEVPVAELLEDGVHREERWEIGPADWPIHFFELEDETVWGATAAILHGFLTSLTSPVV